MHVAPARLGFSSHSEIVDVHQNDTQTTHFTGFGRRARREMNWNAQLGGSVEGEFRILKNLHKFIFKLFMEAPFEREDFNLEPSEKTIIRELMKKKGFNRSTKISFTLEQFKSVGPNRSTKKREDCLKYIFNKAISHLKKQFEQSEFYSPKGKNNKSLNREFYEHYFGAIARRMKTPIEAFYDYSLANKSGNEFTAKSISSKYLSLIKENPEFVGEIVRFLNQEFLKWFHDFNLNKIRLKVKRWEEVLVREGEREGLKLIVSKINSRNNKLFWTLHETRLAKTIAINSLCLT